MAPEVLAARRGINVLPGHMRYWTKGKPNLTVGVGPIQIGVGADLEVSSEVESPEQLKARYDLSLRLGQKITTALEAGDLREAANLLLALAGDFPDSDRRVSAMELSGEVKIYSGSSSLLSGHAPARKRDDLTAEIIRAVAALQTSAQIGLENAASPRRARSNTRRVASRLASAPSVPQ